VPITAIVNGELRDASLFNEEHWQALKESRPVIQMSCCGAAGFMRESSLGTQHFVHCKPSESCTSGPETPEHEDLKKIVANAAQKLGWKVKIEAPDPNGKWRADVLATRDQFKVALEIQLSPITAEKIQRRHETYRASGIRARWFLGKDAWTALYSLPDGFHAFHLWPHPSDEPGPPTVLDLNHLPLPDAVSALLKGHFRFCQQERVTTVEGVTILRLEQCFRCKCAFDIFTLSADQGRCDRDPDLLDPQHDYETGESMTFTSPGQSWSSTGAPTIVRAVQRFVAANPHLKLSVSYPSWHKIGSPPQNMYTFSCVHCGAILDRYDLENMVRYGNHSPRITPIASITLQKEETFVGKKHWCYSPRRRFCQERSPAPTG
jgi:hypothetical protein